MQTTPTTNPSPPSNLSPAGAEPAPPPRFDWHRWLPWLIGAAGLLFAGLIGIALRDLLREVKYAAVIHEVQATSTVHILLAVLATAVSYFALTGYDTSALRYVGVKVRRSTVLLTSFTAYALSNTMGLGVLTGGAVRMRLYTAAGLEPAQVAQVIAFNAGAFGLGMTALGALGLLWGAAEVAPLVHLPPWLLQFTAAVMLAGLVGFIALCTGRRELRLPGNRLLHLPTANLALRQLAISAVDLSASGATLWLLLPEGVVSLPTFIAFYVIGIALGIISHVPGGLGVFEAVILLACGGRAPTEAVIGALVLYRGIYYLLPLVLATALLAFHELRSGIAAPMGRAMVRSSPLLLAALSLVAGLWLLVSGITPMNRETAGILARHVPLPLVEAAHFLGSVAGLGLLLVARGLMQRLDGAWWAALILACVAGVLALPKGIALSEAAMLGTLAALLVVSRHQFDRRSSLFTQRLELKWLLAIGAVVLACVWLLLFVYRHVEYRDELWWQFEFDANAPRALRALAAVIIAGLVVALWQLFRPPSGKVAAPTRPDIDRAADIVRTNPSADACLVLMGDKNLLFSDSGRSFIMFGKHARSWVALFDPVGDAAEWPELVWRFIELATEHGGRAAFYQVRPHNLPLYLDAGLQVFKLGEFAHVPLAAFSLKGPRRAHLRQALNRAEREGLGFEIVPPERVPEHLAELRAISDAWLDEHRAREKSFSLGAFDDDYLQRLPVGIVRKEGRIVAFANLICTEARIESSIDLMRYPPDAPNGAMDFLFVKLMLHFQEQGYQRFDLGMAPMSGMAAHHLAPRWQRFGHLLFEHGERFYNFRGLRSFKDKFDPVWEARYLACPGGTAPILALTDTAALISGGLRGVVGR